MCLWIDKARTRKFKNRTSSKKVVVYKLVSVDSEFDKNNNIISYLTAPYRHSRIDAGFFKSNRDSKNLTEKEVFNEQINYGIHCYISKQIAKKESGGAYLILKGWAYRSDFVAAGTCGDVVFMKVFFPKEEIEKCLGS